MGLRDGGWIWGGGGVTIGGWVSEGAGIRTDLLSILNTKGFVCLKIYTILQLLITWDY